MGEMTLIITEKSIAGKRIAAILAGKDIPATTTDAQFFDFEKNNETYRIVPLRGHIVDVDFPKRYSYWLGTDLKLLVKSEIEYIGKEAKIISMIKKSAMLAKKIIIATDADREGEAIGVEALRYALEANPKLEVKRAYFSAITPQDISIAFAKLDKVDHNFADSADARREIDLIWGAVLTRYLSLISGRLGKEFLSVGRVQSPTLRFIVDREKERLAFKTKKFWELKAVFEKGKKKFEAQHKKGKFWDKGEAEAVLKKRTDKCPVTSVKKTERKLARPAPFNTTDFLRAATATGFSAGGAMNAAESLYMQGYLSYPRTDNNVYSPTLDLKNILNELNKIPEFAPLVQKLLSKDELKPSRGKKSTKDHPPIHPVSAAPKAKLSGSEWKIYELVCRRFMATLADDALTENLTVEIDMNKEIFVAHGQIFIKKGWKEFYPYSKTVEVTLPEMKKGDTAELKNLDMLAKETQPPARYSQGSLIKIMEENNLGTKSTRHSIIQKLYSRMYVTGAKALVPTQVAFAVIDSLEKYGEKVVEPKMTAELEKEMDMIAAAKKSKAEVVGDSREFLTEILMELLGNKDKIATELRQALRKDAIVGACTKEGCTGELIIRFGKTGKRFLGCSSYPKCTNSYPLPQKGKITVLDKMCEHCNTPMIKIFGKRFSYSMCINHECVSKADWGKKKNKKEKGEEK